MDCFHKICTLLDSNKFQLIRIAERATNGDRIPFIGTSDISQVDSKMQELEERIKRTSDQLGQITLIKLIEELYDEIATNNIPGISSNDFLEKALLNIGNGIICYDVTKKWYWKWNLKVDQNERLISIAISKRFAVNSKVVPDYILQCVRQAINSFHDKTYTTSLSLITIALEGTLRDALISKGHSYNRSANSNDVYELKDIHIYRDIDGYKIKFPDSMPLSYTDYLSNTGDPPFKIARIKRSIDNKGRPILVMKEINDIKDYWSSDIISQPAQFKIGGLGAALNVGRNRLNIFTAIDLPPDLDKPIQAVRNNLIHLSGDSLDEEVAEDYLGNKIKLKDFLSDKNRVFDTVCTIADTIDKIYNKISDNTL